MRNSVVLLTKDVLMPRYLPVYGCQNWDTPNINALAKNGTVFLKHYSAAPSTAMSFLAMATGKYPYEFERKAYQHEREYEGNTIFDMALAHGMQPHVVWSENYMKVALPFANCFRGAEIHTLDMNQPVGPHLEGERMLIEDEKKVERTLSKLKGIVDSIPSDDTFLWIHLPHVILGRTCYGGDMDIFDRIVGWMRDKFGDDSIFISADHGNMDGKNGIYGYGFHVYEPAIRIPLITPKIQGCSFISYPTSNTKLSNIIFDRTAEREKYIVSESTYYLQPTRKTAVIFGKYKMIRNKWDDSEELYDIEYDPNEERNLISDCVYDKERSRYVELKEVYFYPYQDDLVAIRHEIKQIMDQIWKNGSYKEELIAKIKYIIDKKVIKKIIKPKKIVRKD